MHLLSRTLPFLCARGHHCQPREHAAKSTGKDKRSWVGPFASFQRPDFGNFASRFRRDEDSENPRATGMHAVLTPSKSVGENAEIEPAKKWRKQLDVCRTATRFFSIFETGVVWDSKRMLRAAFLTPDSIFHLTGRSNGRPPDQGYGIADWLVRRQRRPKKSRPAERNVVARRATFDPI